MSKPAKGISIKKPIRFTQMGLIFILYIYAQYHLFT